MSLTIHKQCPVCESQDTSFCITLAGVPVYCNVLYPTRESSLAAPRGDITLISCRNCGHLFNGTFDAKKIDYSLEYENSLHYSRRFQEYADSLAEGLVERHNLYNKTIIEIACGKGDFLAQLCRLGNNKGIGFDPSYEPGRQSADVLHDITVLRDYYSERYADITADLVCCRHALEHIESPQAFLKIVRAAIGDNRTALYFEVPNSLYTLRDLGIWDIIYEHCGYFSESSLARVFTRCGFSVCNSSESFGNQFLSLEAVPGITESIGGQTAASVSIITAHADAFEKEYAEKIALWKNRLGEFKQHKKQVVVWGAGSKGVTFLNVLEAKDAVKSIVDLNPHKQAKYVPGTGHQVVSPESLQRDPPDMVIVMNPIYADEIKKFLNEAHITADILIV